MSESLRVYLAARGLDERLTMNELQDNGVCSDLCVEVGDVGNGGECVRWLDARDVRLYRAGTKPQ